MSDTKLARVMRAVSTGEMSRAEAAEELECSGRHVNRMMKTYGVVKPQGRTVVNRIEGKARRAARETLQEMVQVEARKVADRKQTVSAAIRALKPWRVSERTIYRYIAIENQGKLTKKT